MTDHLHSSLGGVRQKSELPTRADEKAAKAAEKAANWRMVCKQVDARDQGRCRACGARCEPWSIDPLDRAHRHHLTFRSKGGQDVASNLVTLCASDHDKLHVKRTLRLEAATPYGADGPLIVWRMGGRDGEDYIARRETAVHVVEAD